jgi:imidazolonepropionase-like amidohydrolase
MRSTTLARAGLICAVLSALLLSHPAPAGSQAPSAVLIRNATLIDGTGAPPQPGTNILLEGNRIASVGRSLQPPSGARVIDASGKFVTPGLIDCHVHLDFPIVFQLSPAEKATIVEHTPVAFLYNGVTTILNVSSDAEWIWKQRADQRAGRLVAPRIYAMGRGFTPAGGWGSRHGDVIRTAEEARARARDYIAHKTDGFKVIIEGGLGGSGVYKEIPDDVLQAIVGESRRARVPIYVHAINLADYRRAATIHPRAIVHGLEDPIPAGDPLLKDLAANHVFVVPTISLFEAFNGNGFDGHPERFDDPVLAGSVPGFLLARMRRPEYMKVERQKFLEVARMDVYEWARRSVPIFEANTRLMRDAGIKIGVGTDAGGTVGYNFQGFQTPREIELLVESGFSPMEAIVAATRTGAEIIGVSDSLGTIERGKLADLLILTADPLADIRNIRRIETVIQAGVVHARDDFAAKPAPPTQH